MAEVSRGKGAIKFLFWGAVAIGLFYYAFHTYNTGQMVVWYYYKANTDGYAVNADTIKNANKEKPALLTIGPFEKIEGPSSIPLWRETKGLLPYERFSPYSYRNASMGSG